MYFIGKVGLESQQLGLIAALNNYHGNDGNEQVTPIGVIKEIYSSNQPVLLTMLHFSFSELFQNTQIWASFNNSNQIRKLLRHAPCVVYTLNLYGYKKKLLYILYFRLFLSHRKFVCCFTHKKNKSSKKSFVSFLFISIFATNMYNRKPHKLSFCAFQSIYPT